MDSGVGLPVLLPVLAGMMDARAGGNAVFATTVSLRDKQWAYLEGLTIRSGRIPGECYYPL